MNFRKVFKNSLLNSVTSIDGWQYLSLKSKLLTSHLKRFSTFVIIYRVTCSCHNKYGETERTIEESTKKYHTDVNNETLLEKLTGKKKTLFKRN